MSSQTGALMCVRNCVAVVCIGSIYIHPVSVLMHIGECCVGVTQSTITMESESRLRPLSTSSPMITLWP